MLNKPLIIVLFVSISLNCLFGYLSYSFYSDKAVAESQLKVAIVSNKFMAVSLERKSTACTLQDKMAAENQTEQLQIVEEKDADLNAIDKMVVVPTVLQKTSNGGLFSKEKENVNKQSNVAILDAELPESLRLLLQDSCNRSKGSACTNP